NSITKLADFYGEDYGRYPYGSLTLGPGGTLFGQTYSGGVYNDGIMFEYNTSTMTFTKRFDFRQADEGAMNFGSLLLGTDGWVYGTTAEGGHSEAGTIYRINPADHTFESLYKFDIFTYGGIPGTGLMQAGDGYFYGVTPFGGSVNAGVIYRFDAISKVVTVLEDLITPSEGYRPAGPPVQTSDGLLYGLTYEGGSMSDGALYRFNLSNSTYSKQADFQDAASGSRPDGSLVEAANGKLYAIARQGGQFTYGTLFEYDPNMSFMSVKVQFDGLNKGAFPRGTLLEYSDNKLYGVCNQGGLYDEGTLFVYDAATNSCTKVHDFNATTGGSNPECSLMKASNGRIYGTTNKGGAYDFGTIFEYDPVTSNFTTIKEFERFRDNPWYSALLEVESDFGVDEETEKGFTLALFPNPAKDRLYIQSLPGEKVSIHLMNQTGQVIMEMNAIVEKEGIELDVEALPGGIYLVKVQGEKGFACGKFVKSN
ncbi:MAG: T9SS type A sorting domain-containing protein, partial [Bacteroidetes bacterium]|nr:T9SS type A sorting domain-containing protein [Bacteroidota bacterium]